MSNIFKANNKGIRMIAKLEEINASWARETIVTDKFLVGNCGNYIVLSQPTSLHNYDITHNQEVRIETPFT